MQPGMTRRPLCLLQSRYWDSPHALASATHLVDRKIANMYHLLMQYLPHRERQSMPQAVTIRSSVQQIARIRLHSAAATDHRTIMRMEAGATRAYWTSFATIACIPHGWTRTYPHAHDPWNQALNIGYTTLAHVVRVHLRSAGLCTAIGMLHAPHEGHEALVYDFEELFRQPIVDAMLLPQWSRGQQSIIDPARIVAQINERWHHRTHYHRAWWRMRAVLDAEAAVYSSALRNDRVFIPYRHSWSHWTNTAT